MAVLRGGHTCHAEDCPIRVPPAMFMCRPHWGMVPFTLRSKIWSTYVKGQEVRKDPSPDYLEAARLAVEAVAELEGKRDAKIPDKE